MPIPLLPLLLLGGGALVVATSGKSPAKKAREEDDQAARDYATREIYIAQCPLDANLSPAEQQAVRVVMSAGLLGKHPPQLLGTVAQEMAAQDHPLAAVCLSAMASAIAADQLKQKA